VKTDLFSPHRRIESEFRTAINRIFLRLFQLSPTDTARQIDQKLAVLSSNSEFLEEIGARIALRMATQIRASNARSWREAARRASRGREIYNALEREMRTNVGERVSSIVSENARLISAIPDRIRESVNTEIAEMHRQGLRHEAIAEHLRRRVPELTRSRAALIARTETGKASTAITQARSEDLGIEWYQWATSEDQRVRPSHRIMDKVLVRWSDPPSPEVLDRLPSVGRYAPGEIWNCRCVALPLVALNVVSWPAVVYMNRSLRRMTRAQFVDISGMQRRAA